MLLVATMLFAGCLGANTAEWGNAGIDVDFSSDEASITTNLGDGESSFENLSPIGCNVGEEISPSKNASDRIQFQGFLSASMLYESHDPIDGVRGMDTAVTAAVAIQAMSQADANNVKDGEGARIDIKQWNIPLMPETRAGTVDLDEIDQESESGWYVLGLIPTTENLNDGFRALTEWHKPITIHGYLISPTLVNGSAFTIDGQSQTTGFYKEGTQSYHHTLNNDCELNVGTSNLQSVYVLVDKIELNGEVISSSGNSDDEWKHGDVPILGRAGFILFFLVVGIGGAVGMFILSQMIVRQGAKETMKVLLGDEGIAKIKKVASDLRRDKKSGNISPTERKRQQDKQDREVKKQRKPPGKSKDNTGPIAGFDLDSALSSNSEDDGPQEFGSNASSVVVSQEAIKLEQQAINNEPAVQEEAWTPPTSTRTSSPVSNVVSSQPARKKTEHFTGSVRKESSAPKAAAPIKKRRATKKRKATKPAQEPVEPEPQHEEKVHQEAFEEAEDFSDFSL
jgi:hypothetical protein